MVLDLGEALSDLTVLLKRLIGENMTLNVPQVRDLWPVKADVHQFEQVVINLAINARDAMPLGGTLTLRTGNVGAEESAAHQHQGMPLGEYVRVEVEDTGSGIAPEIIDKIFDPFYTTKDIGKGTGLGLSTVYGIVKQTGGFVFVESELGKGTIFRIFLPRYIPAADDLQVPQLPETTAPALAGAISAADAMRTVATDLTGHGTILLVEDEEELRALNARGLKSRGYTVIEAGNGVEALEELEKQGRKVDIVVSDVVMPEMDGPTLMKELKQRKPDIKIIFVSGYAEDAFDKTSARPQAVQLPGQAVHPQATRHRGEGDDGGVSGGRIAVQRRTGEPIATALFSPRRSARYDPQHERARTGQIRRDPARPMGRQRGAAVFPAAGRGRRDLARQRHVRAARARRLHGAGPQELRAADRHPRPIAARRACAPPQAIVSAPCASPTTPPVRR